MPSSRSLTRARVAAVAATAVAATGLPLLATTPATANPAGTNVVISEVYGGGGNMGAVYRSDFVELYNPTNAAIPLTGMSLQYRAASTGNPGGSAVALTGTIKAKGYFLIKAADGTDTTQPALPTPDATTSFTLGATAGQVLLINGSSFTGTGNVAGNAGLVDMVGYGTGNTFEGATAPGASNGTSVSRNAAGLDRDTNNADFTTGAPAPQNSSTGGTTALALADPGPQTATVGTPFPGLTLTATGGTSPYAFSATGLPAGLTLDATTGAITGTPSASGSFSVTATVTDSRSPSPATASVTFAFTVSASSAVTPIAQIQGTGATTPRDGETVTTRGVVTASYPTGGLNGFYLQTPGADTPDASDAIFVYGGTGGFSSYPAVGDSVRVTGTAGEFSGQTQITATTSGVTTIADLGTVVPKTVVPGTECALPGTGCLSGSDLDAAREVAEGEAFQPTAPWTATDVYDGAPYLSNGTNGSSFFGELGLAANSAAPLVAPTELYDNLSPEVANRKRYNDAHRIVLDDGSSTNYTTTTGQAFPWLTADHAVRVGAEITFPAPVVLAYGFNAWRILPNTRVVGRPTSTQPQVEQTRADEAAPKDVGGDLQLATFNVLNYFPTTGQEYVASGLGQCSYFTDRAGANITTRSCGSPSTSSGNGPRGAADAANLARQQTKIVHAINALGADIVSLEELENSVKFGQDRDAAITELVAALNADAGAGTWDYVPSPPADQLPAVADQDVIRTGFIYRPATVALVGSAQVLADESTGSDTFANAREPLAQAFKKVGAPRASAFAVIVNHFKSKGSGVDDGTGQGNANPDRVAQAQSLAQFADEFKTARGLTRVFLTGDFNAYSSEDPIQALEEAGYTNLESTTDPGEETYNFDGQVGSLDHVLANAAAAGDVAAVDIWPINANESVYYEYSRFNYNLTNLYDQSPFRSSDHNPEIVGIDVGTAKAATSTTAGDVTVVAGDDGEAQVTVAAVSGSDVPTGTVTVTRGADVLGTAVLDAQGAATVALDSSALAAGPYSLTATYGGDADFDGSSDVFALTVDSPIEKIQILATNDFHGRIQNDPSSAAAGAGLLAGAVKQLRAANPNTVFAAAGDLIGASTFESFIAHDKPTIDALNSAGLEVSAVGNHEFDQGYDDLVNRVMAPYDAQTNPYGGATWKYLGANVRFKASGDEALDGTWIKTMDGVQVGFVGAVTEHLDELVSPAGISDIEVTDIVDATNTAADELKAEGADVAVLLVHEGAPSTDCAAMRSDPTSDFGSIVTGVNDNVDAIVSGHTHLAYNCSFPVAGWSGRPVQERPVVSAGQYGANLNQLVFEVDRRTGQVTTKTQSVLPLKKAPTGTASDYTVDAPTQQIVNAAVAQAEVLGAQPLGQVAAPFKRGYLANGTTENRGAESTLGNLVAEVQQWATQDATFGSAQIAFMNPGGLRADLVGTVDGSARTLTYKEAATVQPFANTLVNMDLTGAQLKQVLEQQWQPTGASRPFLKLGISQGFTYTYDPSRPASNRITQMWLDGVPIVATASYSVTVNSFLASGGDNFNAFTGGTDKRDTGRTDLQAMVDYLDEFANVGEGDDPLPVDYSQRAVGVSFPAGAPAAYRPGQHVVLNVSSFSMTNSGDLKDAAVTVEQGGTVLGTFPLDNTAQSALPGQDEVGKATVDVVVPDLPPGTVDLTLVGDATGTEVRVPVTIAKRVPTVQVDDLSVAYTAAAQVTVTVTGGGRAPRGTVELFDGTTSLGTASLGTGGKARLTIPARTFAPGPHTVRVVYGGNEAYESAEGTFVLTVDKAASALKVSDVTIRYGAERDVRVVVNTPSGITATGTVSIGEGGTPLGSAPVVDGVATVRLAARSLTPGPHSLTVSYGGDASVAAATRTVTATVTKAVSTVRVAAAPSKPRVGVPVNVSVTVTATDGVPTEGSVRVSVDGGTGQVVPLVDGKVTVGIGSFASSGTKTVSVEYLGSDLVLGSTKTLSLTVRP